MDKKLIVGLVVLLLVGGAGFLLLNKGGGGAATTSSSSDSGKQGGVFTSLKDALSKSVSLECSFTDERGIAMKVNIKNGAVRTDMTGKTAQESGSVIMKDKKMYFWNQDQGFMMELPEIDASALPQGDNQGSTQAKDVLDAIEQYKDSCKPGIVSDSLFMPPADVKFQDLSAMMQQIGGGAKGSGTPAVNQQDVEKLMQQFGQPADAGQ